MKKQKNSNLKIQTGIMTSEAIKSNTIGEDFCFQLQYDDLKLTYRAFEYYKNHLKKPKDILNEQVVIALDTNLLLDLYKMSFKERSEFLHFVNANASRIVIPAQVEIEYLRHRISHIQNFQKTLQSLKTTAKDYVNTLKEACSFASSQLKRLGNTKIISNDIPEAKGKIRELIEFIDRGSFSDDFKKGLDDIYNPLDEILKEGIDSLLEQSVCELDDDPILAALSKVNILKKLSNEEISYLKGHYDSLLKVFNEKKSITEEKDNYSFPGCGDRKKVKTDHDPYGDFFIYHELLAYMLRNKKDVFFLTRDVTKSDWIKSDGSPFKHYLVDAFKNTNQMLYVFNAEKFIPLTFAPIFETEGKDADGELMEDASVEESADSVNSTKDQSEELSNSPKQYNIRLSYLRSISEERFMNELEVATLWANNYGDGYVSKLYFIYGILGPKHFCYEDSKAILERLKTNGLVEEYTEKKDERHVTCLKILDKYNIERDRE